MKVIGSKDKLLIYVEHKKYLVLNSIRFEKLWVTSYASYIIGHNHIGVNGHLSRNQIKTHSRFSDFFGWKPTMKSFSQIGSFKSAGERWMRLVGTDTGHVIDRGKRSNESASAGASWTVQLVRCSVLLQHRSAWCPPVIPGELWSRAMWYHLWRLGWKARNNEIYNLN